MNACLILNDAARAFRENGGPLAAGAIVDAFRSHGILAESRVAASADFATLVQEAAARKPDVMLVGGGDGSISTAARAVAGTRIPLGVLPLGTLNHFARDLGFPIGWREAVDAIATGDTRSVDVGEVNGRIFINNCSLGSYAEAVRRRDVLRHTQGTGKWWAMTLATLAVFRRLRRIRVRVERDGETLAWRTPFVVVANNAYSGHLFDHSLRPRLDEGRLWLYTTHAARHAVILRFFWQALLRKFHDIEGLEKIPVTDAAIHHDYPTLPVAIDGELATLRSPLKFTIRPRALVVIVPREKRATG